jgi:hypothetical protein
MRSFSRALTDLASLFNDRNIEFPYIDCAALHLIIQGEARRKGSELA